MRHLALVDMKSAKLGTAMKIGEHLAGVQKMPRIKGTFQPLLLFQIILGELDGHQIALFDPDTMFTGQHTAHLDTASQDIRAEFLGPFQLAGLVGIEQDQRMQIAVTGMEHVGNA